jgi:high-affinity K+ transport system ATPase subunit B
LLDPQQLLRSTPDAVRELDPGVQLRNPVMFVVEVGSVLTAECTNGTARALGVIHLKDVVKDGIRERFAEPRVMGIRTIMITGDNQLTAAAIAAEAGVDDFLAEAAPEDKMALIPPGADRGSAGRDDRGRH